MIRRPLYKYLFFLCVIWFICLCFLHYFSQRPLWLDENFILDNITDVNPGQLLGPLKKSQAFPRVYLIGIKIFSQQFSYHVYALRLFPMISMLLAFFIWARVYKKSFNSKWYYLLALFSFTGSYYLIYYAAELKQYSMDVLVAGFFTLYLSWQKLFLSKKLSKSFLVATWLLPCTILFSHISFLFFWIVIYNFLFILKNNPKALKVLIGYSLLCFVFVIFVFYFDIKYTLSAAGLFSYWNGKFLHTDSLYSFFKNFGEGFRKLSVWWFGNSRFYRRAASFVIPLFGFSLFGYGIRAIKKEGFKFFDIDALALVIFFELLILGMLKKYPFTGERITLFFAPFVFYLTIKGISFLKTNKPLYLSFIVLYTGLLMLCSINSFRHYLGLYL